MKSIATKFLLPVVVLAAIFMMLDVYQDYQGTKEETAELVDRQAAMARLSIKQPITGPFVFRGDQCQLRIVLK